MQAPVECRRRQRPAPCGCSAILAHVFFVLRLTPAPSRPNRWVEALPRREHGNP